MTTTIHIAPSIGTSSTCTDADGALDYSVTLSVDEVEIEIEVTLIPEDGALSAWGSLEHWISPQGVRVLRALSDTAARQLASEIEAACSDGEEREVEVDTSEIESRGEDDGSLDDDATTEAAINAAAHTHAGVPDLLAVAYYAGYERGQAREAQAQS